MPMFKPGQGCFKTGCIGCLVAVGAFVVLLLAWAGLQSVARRAPVKEEHTERSLPLAAPATPPEATSGAPSGSPSPSGGSSVEIPGRTISRAEPLHLELRLAKGRFVVQPGRPGEPLRVEGDYDTSRFELTDHYDAEARRYEVRFDARGGWLGLIGNTEDSRNEVRIFIPPGVPFLLDAKLSTGQSDLELGGLSLLEADLGFGVGDHRLSFHQPLPQAIERLDIEGSVGELRIAELGNASPQRLRVSNSVGNLQLDLAGNWRQDSEIDVQCGLGECRVDTPDDVNVVVERARVALGEVSSRSGDEGRPTHPGAPTLHLRVSAKMGQVRVH